jgi:hypothetical protein
VRRFGSFPPIYVAARDRASPAASGEEGLGQKLRKAVLEASWRPDCLQDLSAAADFDDRLWNRMAEHVVPALHE